MKKFTLLLFLVFLYLFSYSQPGSLDHTFDPGQGFNKGIFALALQPDNKIIVGGYFTNYNGLSRNCIVRIDEFGNIDNSFDIGLGFEVVAGGNQSVVFALAVQSDGKIIAGGSFNFYNSERQNLITRINSDGSRDASFNIGSGFDSLYGVTSIIIQPDGRILVAGSFLSYNGINKSCIVRLNTDGTLDQTFNVDNGLNTNGNSVYDIIQQSDGKIIVVGIFNSFNGTSRNYILRLNLDGSLDNSFEIGTGFTGVVNGIYALALQPNGKIIAGGDFTGFNGTLINRIARLNSDGSLDTDFVIGNGFNQNETNIFSLALQTDGKIIAGGDFTSYNGSNKDRIVRINSNGTADESFISFIGFNASVTVLLLQFDEKILAGGDFTQYNGITRKEIARLNGGSVGIETNETENKIQIYNSHNQLFITLLTQTPQPTTAIVYNLLGEVITSASFNSQTFQLQLPELPASVLLVRVTSNEFDITKKVVVGVE